MNDLGGPSGVEALHELGHVELSLMRRDDVRS